MEILTILGVLVGGYIFVGLICVVCHIRPQTIATTVVLPIIDLCKRAVSVVRAFCEDIKRHWQEMERQEAERRQKIKESAEQWEREMAEQKRQWREAQAKMTPEILSREQECQETIVMEVDEDDEPKKQGTLTNYDSTNVGSIYVLEWDEGGGWVKIGSAIDPRKRITRLKAQFEGYSDIVIGKTWHIDGVKDFRKKEHNLHVLLEKYRKPKTELFDIPFDDAIYHVQEYVNSFDDD